MPNPTTQTWALIVFTSMSLAVLGNAWLALGWWAPVIGGIWVVIVTNWAKCIGRIEKELEYTKKRK